MAETISHRGPDGRGLQLLPGCGLAHQRLAIIDLSPGGHQPMVAEDRATWVVFNGEIYNYLELKAELSALGHHFRSQSDTEVILAGWLQWGTEVFARLDGMFAIALYDTRSRRLVLSRDRTGKKPLYVYEDAEKLVFGSELKAVLACPGVNASLQPESIVQFLANGYVPTPGTSYLNVRKVRPATYEVHEPGRRERVERQYWDFPLGPTEAPADLEETKAELRRLLFAAVKKRLMSDVPLGAFLSGGIDSTLVVAAMAAQSTGRVKTFSIGFEGHPEYDETAFARQVAERYGTEHTEFKVGPEDFGLIEKLAWHYDEPFGDSSAIPTYIVSKLTRSKVTVALTGDGGDELFGGYPRFIGAVAAERLPRAMRALAGRLARPLPAGARHGTKWEKARRFALHAALPLPERLRNWVSLFAADDLERLLRPGLLPYAAPSLLGAAYSALDRHTGECDPINRVLYLNARTYLLDDLNVKMDRASMAASLETRSPFLDTDLMEFAFRLPGNLKVHGTTLKWIIKQTFTDLLPEGVVNRPKMGFSVPLGAWFREGLGPRLKEKLLAHGAPIHEYLRRDAIEELFTEHDARRRDLGLQFWGLWLLDSWLERARRPPRTA
jgi:asparagine synthase (glutamine-hydrolysing)